MFAAELFTWLYTNTHRRRLNDFALGLGVKEDKLYETIASVFEDSDTNKGFKDKVQLFMPEVISQFATGAEGDPYLYTGAAWMFPTFNTAITGFGKYSKIGTSGIGDEYLSNLITGNKSQDEIFMETFDEIFPQFRGDIYQSYKQSMADDASAARFLQSDGLPTVFNPERKQFMGRGKATEGEMFEQAPWKAGKDFYRDYLSNHEAHHTAMYDNAWELAQYLDEQALVAEGEDYTIGKGIQDKATRMNVIRRFGFDPENWSLDDQRLFSWTQNFNPLIYGLDTDEALRSKQNILSMAVAAMTPAGTPPTKRDWYQRAVERDYELFIRNGGNPNSFLLDQLNKGRIISSRSKYYEPGVTKSGEKRFEEFTQPLLFGEELNR